MKIKDLIAKLQEFDPEMELLGSTSDGYSEEYFIAEFEPRGFRLTEDHDLATSPPWPRPRAEYRPEIGKKYCLL